VGERQAGKTRVLVVDDEATDLSTLGSALKAAGCEVFEAAGYREAMAHAKARGPVNLLIADISLPDGNGCALALAMRRHNPALRVLFISGHVGTEVCKYYGLDVEDIHFLRKPFKREELLSRVQHVLASGYAFPRLTTPKVLTSTG